MRLKKSVIIMLSMILIILCGCMAPNYTNGETQNTGENQADDVESNSLDKEEGVKIANNDTVFFQARAEGCALWFDKWQLRLYGNEIIGYPDDEGFFKIDGTTYNSGLGFDGLTIEGLDKRGYSYLEYEVQSGSYRRITGVFAFDDTSRYRPDSKLIIYTDDKIIYKSEYINDEQRSIEIDIPIKSNIETIAFRVETISNTDVIPKILLADFMAHR